jgi:hypothetical protein
MPVMRRTLYVDGFNFYYGVTRYWRRKKDLAGLGWCDFRALVERNFPASGELTIKYFTAPVNENDELVGNLGEHERYWTWRRALSTIRGLTVTDGFYKHAERRNLSIGLNSGREEKQTDVNLAVEMILDAHAPPDSRPEHVFLLCGDYDQMPAVFCLQERAPVPIRVTVLLPSGQSAEDWDDSYAKTRTRLLANFYAQGNRPGPGKPHQVVVLRELMLARSLLPYELHDKQGTFACPDFWRLAPSYLAGMGIADPPTGPGQNRE